MAAATAVCDVGGVQQPGSVPKVTVVSGGTPGVPAAATVLAIEATLCEPLASGGEPRRLASLVRTLARTVHGEPLTDFSTDFSIDQEL